MEQSTVGSKALSGGDEAIRNCHERRESNAEQSVGDERREVLSVESNRRAAQGIQKSKAEQSEDGQEGQVSSGR